MTREQFWELIEGSRGRQSQFEWLESELAARPPGEILEFAGHLNHEMVRAYTWPFLVAAFVLNSYVSDDVFEDSRAWLVSQGRDRFEAAIDNPDSIADWHVDNDEGVLGGEGLLLLPVRAFVAAGGEEEEFYRSCAHVPEPDIETPWPDSRDGIREMMPRVVDQFWNQDRINEMHRD